MNGTWIHLNLKTIKIDQTQKINTYSKSTIESLEKGVTSFCWGVDRVPQHRFQGKCTCSKSKIKTLE